MCNLIETGFVFSDEFSIQETSKQDISQVPETRCPSEERDEMSTTTQVFEVVDLYDSNNNAQDCMERVMSKELVVRQSLQMLSRSRSILHSVEEVEDERSD